MSRHPHGVLHHHHGGGPYTGPLDIVPGALAAYSQRALSSALRGSAVYTIREAAGNTTRTFNSDASTGAVSAAAIITFLAGANGFCTTWNDQSGNGNNVAQGTTANQPKWLSTGPSGTPAFDFTVNNSRGVMGTAGNVNVTSSGLSLYAVIKIIAAQRVCSIFCQGFNTLNGGTIWIADTNSSASNADFEDSTGSHVSRSVIGGTVPADQYFLLEFRSNNSSSDVWTVNGADQSTGGSTHGFTGLNYPLSVGGNDFENPGGDNNGILVEAIMWNSDIGATNAAAVRANIAAYYGITLG